MKTIYEVKHCGRSKKFERLEDATKHGKALEDLGYKVTLNMITISLYNTITILIYRTNEKEVK